MNRHISNLINTLLVENDLFNDDIFNDDQDILTDNVLQQYNELIQSLINNPTTWIKRNIKIKDLEYIPDSLYSVPGKTDKERNRKFGSLIKNIILGLRHLITDDTKLNLNWINTNNITSFEDLFNIGKTAQNVEFKNIDISKWDTSKVIDMNGTFAETKSVPDISQWDVSNVTDMTAMFYECQETRLINVAGWNTEKLENISQMFQKASSVIIDFTKLNLSNVKHANSSFALCKYINPKLIENMDVSNVIDMTCMFLGAAIPNCKLNWDVHNVRYLTSMFADSTFNGDIENWNLTDILGAGHMFNNCPFNGPLKNWNITDKMAKDDAYLFKIYSDRLINSDNPIDINTFINLTTYINYDETDQQQHIYIKDNFKNLKIQILKNENE